MIVQSKKNFNYYSNFLSIYRDYKSLFLYFDNKILLKIVNFLNQTDLDKWVFSFIHSEGFYKKIKGDFYSTLTAQTFLKKDLLTLFFNTKATFNTMLFIKARMPRILTPDGEWEMVYRYSNIINPYGLRNSFINLSRNTGGVVISTDNIDQFLGKIKNNEDILYNLVLNMIKTN